LHKDFIKDHLSCAKDGFFTQGTRVLLEEKTTYKTFNSTTLNIKFFSMGIKNRKNTIHSKLLRFLFSTQKNNLKGIKTCNLAFFKEDCMAINGFNEDFIGWGREDSEFAVRLLNRGIKRQNIKFNAIAYHLHHKENNRSCLPQNDTILKNTIEKKLAWCDNGIDKYLKGLHNEH
jgi:predicted glycosyltransferase involved in capsule biosynthesis